jgi:hypothetical protein
MTPTTATTPARMTIQVPFLSRNLKRKRRPAAEVVEDKNSSNGGGVPIGAAAAATTAAMQPLDFSSSSLSPPPPPRKLLRGDCSGCGSSRARTIFAQQYLSKDSAASQQQRSKLPFLHRNLTYVHAIRRRRRATTEDNPNTRWYLHTIRLEQRHRHHRFLSTQRLNNDRVKLTCPLCHRFSAHEVIIRREERCFCCRCFCCVCWSRLQTILCHDLCNFCHSCLVWNDMDVMLCVYHRDFVLLIHTIALFGLGVLSVGFFAFSVALGSVHSRSVDPPNLDSQRRLCRQGGSVQKLYGKATINEERCKKMRGPYTFRWQTDRHCPLSYCWPFRMLTNCECLS